MEKQMYDAICSSCSKGCQVPFQPKGNQTITCKDCWKKGQTLGKDMGKTIAPVPTSFSAEKDKSITAQCLTKVWGDTQIEAKSCEDVLVAYRFFLSKL